jgi:hypothetical protein
MQAERKPLERGGEWPPPPQARANHDRVEVPEKHPRREKGNMTYHSL